MDMDIFFRLILISLIPICLSIVLYVVKKKTKFTEVLPYWAQQAIYGVLFGIAACLATAWGVDVGGATANVRDAGPLCAGLLFGAPAGIIAGVIGGVHRYIAAYYGAGMYSQIACSVSTILAGFYAAVLRTRMFEDHRCTWNMGALVAVVMEVVHMILLFITHLSDVQQAYTIIRIVTVPMVFANSFAVGMAAANLQVIHTRFVSRGNHHVKSLTEVIQQWLLLAIFAAYIVTTAFVYVLQTNTATYDAEQLLTTNLEDVKQDIKDEVDDSMLSRARLLVTDFESDGADVSRLMEYAEKYGFQEINVVDANGICTSSTVDEYVGFDFNSGAQSQEFLILNRFVVGSYVQDYGTITYDERDVDRARKYCGIVLQQGGFIQLGYDYEGLHQSLNEVIEGVAKNRRIGQNGYVLISDASGNVISDYAEHTAKSIEETGAQHRDEEAMTMYEATVYGEESLCMYDSAEGFDLYGVISKEEVYDSRDTGIYVNSFMEVIAFATLFALIFYLVKLVIVNDIHRINFSLSRIIGGKLDERVDMKSAKEMNELSGYINNTVDTLNKLIAEAAERMKKDMDLAKNIQQGALPCIFPPYPEVKEFDIYATMDTAKEVGGDFYDFFMVGTNRLAFVIADVSGKGVPAAMFMMRAKTLIKTHAETGKDAASVITDVNNALCQNNEAGMFVTCWFGILDYTNGNVVFVNAGHNPPLLCRKGEGYSYFKSRAGLVLAGMEGVPYRSQEMHLNPGDRLFLYTDGVTEATSIHTELYGEDRLLNYLNAHQEDSISEIPAGVKADIDRFIEGADQFDDITMLVLDYYGPEGEEKK